MTVEEPLDSRNSLPETQIFPLFPLKIPQEPPFRILPITLCRIFAVLSKKAKKNKGVSCRTLFLFPEKSCII